MDFNFEHYLYVGSVPFGDSRGVHHIIRDDKGNELLIAESSHKSGKVAVNRRAWVKWMDSEANRQNTTGRRGIYFRCTAEGKKRTAMIGLCDFRPEWKSVGDSQFFPQDLTLIPACPELPGAKGYADDEKKLPKGV